MKRIITTIAAIITIAISASAELNIDKIVGNEYSGKKASSFTPMADGEHYLMSVDDKYIVRYSFKTGNAVDTLFNVGNVRGERLDGFDGYILSPTEDKILIQKGRTRIFRNSFSADYYIHDIHNNRIVPLSEGGQQQAPKFSPDGHSIAFVRDGNIFLVKMLFNNAESQVTRDGKAGSILNGVPDWCYDEEFSISSAYDFSADSKMLAYVRFNCTDVDKYTLPVYLTKPVNDAPEQNLLDNHEVWYPVTGSAYSTVSVHTFDIKTAVTRDLKLQLDRETYVPRIKFVDDEDNTLFVFTINRNQNQMEYFSANPRSTECKMVLRQNDERYIEPEEFLNTRFYGRQFIMESERDGHNHLYLYNTNGQLVRQLTKGDWQVLRFNGWDPKTQTLYYTATTDKPYESALFKMDSKGKTVRLSTRATGNVSASFGSGLKYYVSTWSDINTPPIVTVCDNSGRQLRVVFDNEDIHRKTTEDGFVKREIFSFQTSDGTTLYGWIVKPANADGSHRYPVLMYQYGGPGSNEVIDEWGSGFYAGGSYENWLLQDGIISVCIDGRGTGRRGADFKKQTYLNLGIMESDDQVEAAKYLATLPYVDKDRIAIWGWSYGGYNTLMSMSQGTPVFKCGIAVAPVTDWRYYDATYTERFMRTPGQNGDGYRKASALNRIDNLHGRLFLVHGLMDDNVFFSNTSTYTGALIEKGIIFNQQVYSDKEHSLVGASTRKHLFLRMRDFLLTYL